MNQQVKTTHLQSKTVRYARSKFATRVTATDKREHACSGRWPVPFLRDDRKNNLRTKTKSKNKKRQTCAPGVHVDDRSVNSRPNSEGVNKTVNTPGVKRDFSAYASPKIHFISSITDFSAYASPKIHFISSINGLHRTSDRSRAFRCPHRYPTERRQPPHLRFHHGYRQREESRRRPRHEPLNFSTPTIQRPSPLVGDRQRSTARPPVRGGGLTHAPLRAWDPKRTTQQTEGTPPASGKGAFDVGCRVGGGNSPHLRAACPCRSPCP